MRAFADFVENADGVCVFFLPSLVLEDLFVIF